MKYLLFTLLLCAGLGFVQAQSSDYYPVTGTVLDHEKKPVAGAKVSLFSPDAIVAVAYTNDEGQYELTDVPTGDYDFMISTRSGRNIVMYQIFLETKTTEHEQHFTLFPPSDE